MARSLHRALAVRILVTTLIIASVLAALVLCLERDRVSTLVAERVAQRAELLNADVQALLDTSAPWDPAPFESFLAQLRRVRLKDRLGYFVMGGVYDGYGRTLAEAIDREFARIAEVEDFYRQQSLKLPAAGAIQKQVIRIGDRPYVFAAAPLTNSRGESVAVLRGVHAVSDTAVSDARRRIWRTVLGVVAIVAITSALLYPVIISLLRKLTRFSNYLLEANLETLKVLGNAIAKRDSDTNAHNYRVTIFSVRIAEAMGLDRNDIQRLVKGAFLHDVGKIAITDNVLLKPGRLDEEEFRIMKTHVDHGIELVIQTPWLQDARDVVGAHHEKCDGSGYPQGLSQKDIPITARIFAVADVFDALTSQRPYKEPYSFEDSLRILEEGRGSHFDPDVLDAFQRIARPLYDQFCGREDEGLRKELDSLIQTYFNAETDSLHH